MNKLLASVFYSIEVGRSRALVRLIPLLIVVGGIIGLYDIKLNKGFSDAHSMDNAQLARQLVRHQGFQTYFIRPFALTQVGAYEATKGQKEMFPDALYPVGAPRSIVDTYNSPGFPVLLSLFYRVLHTDFDETNTTTAANHYFSGDRWVPLLNQVFILLTAGLLFVMGMRLFDQRVAWMGSVAFVFSDFVWRYSLLASPINLLMFLMTVLLFAFVEISRVGEVLTEEGEKPSLGWAWLVVPVTAILFGLMCLFSLPLLVLTVPLVIWLLLMPRTNWLFLPIFAGIVALMVAPWFYHWYRACGNPLGSNLTLGLLGAPGYVGNQVFCSTSIPNVDTMFGASGGKEYTGFVWYFQRGWDLLGSSPLVLLFAASLLHEFRRRRVQALRWLVVALAFCIVGMTSLANAQPEPVSEWNLVAVLLPTMLMIGSAFFFVLLDRMVTQLRLLTAVIVVIMLVLSFAPMLVAFTGASSAYYNYPPYLPPYISYLARLAPADEWITSDMPWATAWYGDHPSLWLPETTADFNTIYDTDCESDFILLTPVTLSKPALTLTSGELKDWLPVLFNMTVPENFPLKHAAKLPAGGPEYTLVSNRFGGSPSR